MLTELRRALSAGGQRHGAWLFAALGSDRDRAIVAFCISTGARTSGLLGVTCSRVDVGQQLVGVVRKGSGALQWLPAARSPWTLDRQGASGPLRP
jgi:hypothetical protein